MGFWDSFIKAFNRMWNSFVSVFDTSSSKEGKLDELSAKILKSFKVSNERFEDIGDADQHNITEAELKHLKEEEYLEITYLSGPRLKKKFYVKVRGKEVMVWWNKEKGAFMGELKHLYFCTIKKKDGKEVVEYDNGVLKVSNKKLEQGILLPTVSFKLTSSEPKLSKCGLFRILKITLHRPKPVAPEEPVE
jgi:hypothetical protein